MLQLVSAQAGKHLLTAAEYHMAKSNGSERIARLWFRSGGGNLNHAGMDLGGAAHQ
jgi:hypothetical protein